MLRSGIGCSATWPTTRACGGAEIVALDVADIRASARKGTVRVRGKGRFGGKDRTVPLHAEVRSSLERLLDKLGRPSVGPLVRNRDGGVLSARAAAAAVTALGAAAGIGPDDDGEAAALEALTVDRCARRRCLQLVTHLSTESGFQMRYALPSRAGDIFVTDLLIKNKNLYELKSWRHFIRSTILIGCTKVASWPSLDTVIDRSSG